LTLTLGVCHNSSDIRTLRRAVTPDERERMAILCQRIATEKNPEKFDKLVAELTDLLELKHRRIHPEHKTEPI
jgi:hypothetical protein